MAYSTDRNQTRAHRQSRPDRKSFPPALKLFSAVLAGLTFLSLLKAFSPVLLGSSRPLLEPFLVPLWGIDLYGFTDRFVFLHRPEFFGDFYQPWFYPAPSAFFYWFFYRVFFRGPAAPGPLANWLPGYIVYAAIALLPVVFAANRLARAARQEGFSNASSYAFFFSTLLMAWPIYLSLQRGNIESLIWLILAAGVWAFRRERWTAAAALIGLAAAFKWYPVIYLALFLPRQKWRQIGVGLATMATISLAGLRFVTPDLTFAARKTALGVHQFAFTFGGVNTRGERILDHSFFEVLKSLLTRLGSNVQPWIGRYLLMAAVLMTAIYFLRVVRLPFSNQLLLLAVASVFLPPVSFDYTLQSLYIPWTCIVFLLLRNREQHGQPRDDPRGWWPYAVMALFALELAPITFVTHHGLSIGGFIKGLGLAALVVMAATVPMAENPRSAQDLTLPIRP